MEHLVTAIKPIWQASFGEKARPQVYSGDAHDDDGTFQPLTDPQGFCSGPVELTSDQLFAIGSNNQIALITVQNEYTDIQRLLNDLQAKEIVKDPQVLPGRDIYEEQKESSLYGYRYDKKRPALLNHSEDQITEQEKADVRLFQEPFEQGGFVPTERQYKSIMAKAEDTNNPDGWQATERNGKRLIPRQQTYRPEYVKSVLLSSATDDNYATRATRDSIESATTPSKAPNKVLGRTRFRGMKVPATRDVSEAPSTNSTPRTRKRASPEDALGAVPLADPDNSPGPKRRKVTGGSAPSPLVIPDHQAFSPLNGNNHNPPTPTSIARINMRRKVPSTADGPIDLGFMASLSPNSLRNRKWKSDREFFEAVKRDHSWLALDPSRALHLKDKLIKHHETGGSVIKSYSMHKKWAAPEWKDGARSKGAGDKKEEGQASVQAVGGAESGAARRSPRSTRSVLK